MTMEKNNHLKMYFLLKIGIFQCHVSFQGCIPYICCRHFLIFQLGCVLKIMDPEALLTQRFNGFSLFGI